MAHVFSTLKVIDLSTVLAGPSVTTFFAELGARVIKIENKRMPDVTRSWKLPSEDPKSGVSAYFSSVNYKKEYLQLDLRNEEDYRYFLELVTDADILVSNFKKGDEEKLAVTDSILRTTNPGLIIGKISGFGSESDRVAYDLILQAETGFMSMNGTLESGPVKMPVALIDVLAGHHLKEGLLVALLEREQGNAVKTVSVSLYEAAVCSLMNQASNYLMAGQIPQRMGSLHPNIAPYGEIFKTKDDQVITLAIGSDAHFVKLCTVLGVKELPSDTRFVSNTKRVQHREILFKLLAEPILLRSADELLESLLAEHVPAGKVKNLAEVFSNNEARALVKEETIDGQHTKRVKSVAFRLS
jgi:crotonobetainyl-CoA:carnitine CoA-transferase CaiB-like acyl-CoA transferase